METKENLVKVTWKKPLSKHGVFMNGTPKFMNGQLKQIIYTDRFGKERYADPFSPGEVECKANTPIYLHSFNKSKTLLNIYLNQDKKPDMQKEISERTAGMLGFIPESNGELSKKNDSNSGKLFDWGVMFVPVG